MFCGRITRLNPVHCGLIDLHTCSSVLEVRSHLNWGSVLFLCVCVCVLSHFRVRALKNCVLGNINRDNNGGGCTWKYYLCACTLFVK